MLSLEESIEIHEKIKLFEGESTDFTDQQLDAAEFYRFKWNPVTFGTEVTLYDEAEQPLGTVSFEDADIAVAFIEELFEIDPEEAEGLENYNWVGDVDGEYSEDELAATVNNID